MRETLLGLLIALPGIGVLISTVLGLQLWRFVRARPGIETETDLLVFKRVVAGQMYGALAQIVVLGSPLVLFFYGIWAKVLAVRDVTYLILPSLVVLAVGLLFKRVEGRARRMQVAEPLRQAYDHVVRVWFKKALPDW